MHTLYSPSHGAMPKEMIKYSLSSRVRRQPTPTCPASVMGAANTLGGSRYT
jgi:hypothetical protein